jgi:hypothetical protein
VRITVRFKRLPRPRKARDSQEAVGSRPIEPEILGQTQVAERIPAVRACLRCRVARIEREVAAHGSFIAENRRRMNVGARDFGVCGQNRFDAIQ